MKNGFLLVGLLIFYSFLSTTFCQSIRIGEVKEEDIVPRDDWWISNFFKKYSLTLF